MAAKASPSSTFEPELVAKLLDFHLGRRIARPAEQHELRRVAGRQRAQ